MQPPIALSIGSRDFAGSVTVNSPTPAECHARPETDLLRRSWRSDIGHRPRSVRTFYTSSRRPETGRSHRRTRAPVIHPAGDGRVDHGKRARRPVRTTNSLGPPRYDEPRLLNLGNDPAVAGGRHAACGAAPSGSRALRVASDGPAKPAGPPLTLEPLRPLGPEFYRQAISLPEPSRAARPPQPQVAQSCVNDCLTVFLAA
jgi:hypothetical protein